MTRQNARMVIEGPCRLKGIDIEAGFPETLLEKLNPDSREVELTWLQVYLDKVFRMASGDGQDATSLTVEMVEKAGEVKDLLGTFLEEQISKLEDPESALVILKSFVSVKGTRNSIAEEDAIEYSKTFGKDIDREKTKDLIQKFIRLRILRDKDENGRYELRHDSLAAKIYEKITLVEKELLEIRQFLENAYDSYEKRELFLSADDLKYIAPYEDKLFLNEKILKFITHSKRAQHAAKLRRQRVFAAASIIIIAMLSFFTIWALKEKKNAEGQERDANIQRELAENKKAAADSAKTEAEISRNLAIDKELLALKAQKQAEEARAEAVFERSYALQQKKLAEEASGAAQNQARIATEEKHKADSAKAEAVKAEEETRRYRFLSVAQNLALKSASIEKDPLIRGLLAVQAYIYNKNNDGKSEDPVIYDALNKAFLDIDSSRHTVFTDSPNEIRHLAEKNDGSLCSVDMDGQIRRWSQDGTSALINTLLFKSPVNFIAHEPSGVKLITQHDNLSLLLWTSGPSEPQNYTFRELKGHKGFVRTAAFTGNGQFLATAGRDSSIIVWDINGENAEIVNTINTRSGIRSMAFTITGVLSFALDDGAIDLWEISQGNCKTIYSAAEEKPISLAWNDSRKSLFAGCSNGTLLLIDLSGDKPSQISRFAVHTAGIDLITFNHDFSMMATSGWDKTIKFYYYHDYFDLKNSVGGAQNIRNTDSGIRALLLTHDNRLVAGLSDRSIRIWETSSEKLASMICKLVKRDMTVEEWNEQIGEGIPYERTCNRNP